MKYVSWNCSPKAVNGDELSGFVGFYVLFIRVSGHFRGETFLFINLTFMQIKSRLVQTNTVLLAAH